MRSWCSVAVGGVLLLSACGSEPQVVVPERRPAEVARQTKTVKELRERAKICEAKREARRKHLVYAGPNPYRDRAAKKPDGAKVFSAQLCGSCHSTDGHTILVGPNLAERWGRQVELATGEQVTFDYNYVQESIANPREKLHQGFPAVMPDFGAKLTPEEIQALADYVRSLSHS